MRFLIGGLIVLGLGAVLPAAQRQDDAQTRAIQTVVVPVHGQVSVTTAAIVRRGYAEVRARGAARLVLDIDTPGGPIKDMREVEMVLATIRQDGVHTAAYVRRQALSAGGYIALACQEIYVAPGSSLGAITPVASDPVTGQITQIPDDDARSKAYAAMRADVRALVERRGTLRRDVINVVEAMVDPNLRAFELTYEDKAGLTTTEILFEGDVRRLEAEGTKILSRREFGSRPVVLTADECVRLGIAKGRHASLDALIRDEYATTMATTLVLEESWSESAVDWLDGMKLILFALGFVLLLIEMKTPGFAVPGVLGVAMLGLGMFSSYLVGLADITEILLLFLGLVALAVEIFVMPGSVVFGAIGFLFVVAAMILSQQAFVVPGNQRESDILSSNLTNLLLLALGVIGLFAAYVKFLPRIPFLNRVFLAPPEREQVSPAVAPAASSLRARIGSTARTVSDLRPAGIVEFVDGTRCDAVSRGEFIAEGQPVKVLDTAYQRVVVEVAGEPGSDPGSDASGGPPSGAAGQVSIGLLFLLLIIGLVLVVAEIFFVSMGALGAASALTLLTAVVLAFTHHGQVVGFLFLSAAAIGAPVVAYFALKALPNTRLGQQLLLAGPNREDVTRAAAEPDLERYRDQTGVTESVLRPAGIARIAGRRVDVISRGEMIEAGTAVRVINIEGNRVVVAATESKPNP